MNKYYDTVTNTRGDSLPNYRVQVVTSAGAIVSIYADKSSTRFTDGAGNVVNYATTGSTGAVEFYWTAADGQVLQVLDVNGDLVSSTPDFADNLVLDNLPGNIAQAAVAGLATDLAAKADVADLDAKADVAALDAKADTADLASTDADKVAALVGLGDGGTVAEALKLAIPAADNLAATQAAANAAKILRIPQGRAIDLGGGTLTLPANGRIELNGGTITNGTIVCNETTITGERGFTSSLTLSGTLTTKVYFDWFANEKAAASAYDTFINNNVTTYGAVPTIGTTNRIILAALITAKYEVQFGAGIYPFDAAVVNINAKPFMLEGAGKDKTLLWAPNSDFLHYTAGGATYPYLRKLRIEADGAVLRTDAWIVNAIHGLVFEESFFVSYSNHTFFNDDSTPGGSGCPIYGSKVRDCGVYAGPDMGMFYGWDSGSNVFDNMPETHIFFNNKSTAAKGVPKAMFWNSNALDYCNSNISYAGMDYVFYFDKSGLWRASAHNNIFENNANSFQAIVKAETGTSNLHINFKDNLYLGEVERENGYAFISWAGNTYIHDYDGSTPIQSNTIRNQSASFVRSVGSLVDSGGTKYRLGYDEPYSFDNGIQGVAVLKAATSDLARSAGMQSIYDADSANISSVQVRRSLRAIRGDFISGAGTTAQRPTANLYEGLGYYDRTLSKPIWYSGSGWIDAAGVAV